MIGRGYKNRIKLTCPNCLKEFELVRCRLRRRCKNHYCSLKCSSSYTAKERGDKQRKKVYPCKIGICKYCNKNIIAKNSSFDKPTRQFCSRSCKGLAGKGRKPFWTDEARKKFGERTRNLFKGKKKTLEQRLKMRDNNLGPKSHFWKGGITDRNHKRRSGIEYREWRKNVYERDNYTCQICGARSCAGKNVFLNADHIKPWALYPELRFDVSNGRTLCLDCHKKTDTFAVKTSVLVQKLLDDKFSEVILRKGV